MCSMLKFDNKDICKMVFKNFLEHSFDKVLNEQNSIFKMYNYKKNCSIYKRYHFD